MLIICDFLIPPIPAKSEIKIKMINHKFRLYSVTQWALFTYV